MRFRILGVTALLAALATFAFPQTDAERDRLMAGEAERPEWTPAPVRAPHAMVVSDEALADDAGLAILRRGGNAVDAAVAVAFALAVVEPQAGNIGGGGFMLIRMANGKTSFLDYRETAPGRATRDMYLDPDGKRVPKASTDGYRAVAVPGTVAGMELALLTFGTKRLGEAMAPAIRLAGEGFPLSDKLARSLVAAEPRLRSFPVSRRIFLKNGAFYRTGETFRQPALAATLRRIARRGAAEFYRGRTARELAREMAANGGILTLEDLADYRPKLRAPLQADYEISGSSWHVIAPPPPSAGGIGLLEALNILAPIPLDGWNGADSIHWVAETMRRVSADRSAYLADADFSPVPTRGLVDPRYAATLRATIDPVRASPSSELHPGDPSAFDPGFYGHPAADMRTIAGDPGRSSQTTHISVVDAEGNAVSNTFTLNDSYGSGVTTSDGFLLNDEMDDFTTAPGQPNELFHLVQSDANSIAPGKRPLSSMTPVILLRDGKLSLVAGSPGGPRILSAVLLTVLDWMRLGFDVQSAVNSPRFHHQWLPDKLDVEPDLPAGVRAELERRGYTIEERRWIGDVNAIGIDPRTAERLGAADPRRSGSAKGF